MLMDALLPRRKEHHPTILEIKAEVASVNQRTHEDAHEEKKEYLEAADPRNTGWRAITQPPSK